MLFVRHGWLSFRGGTISPGQFTCCEKHSAHSMSDLRGPASIEAVFLIAPGSHRARKRPQLARNAISDNRVSPLIRHFTRSVFLQLVHMPVEIVPPRRNHSVEARGCDNGAGSFSLRNLVKVKLPCYNQGVCKKNDKRICRSFFWLHCPED